VAVCFRKRVGALSKIVGVQADAQPVNGWKGRSADYSLSELLTVMDWLASYQFMAEFFGSPLLTMSRSVGHFSFSSCALAKFFVVVIGGGRR